MFLRYLLEVACLSAFTASLAVFIDFCLQEGNVFGWYGKWLEKKQKEYPAFEYWAKPLGSCRYCFGTWIFICTYLILVSFYAAFLPIKIVLLFLGCGVNYVWICVLSKLD